MSSLLEQLEKITEKYKGDITPPIARAFQAAIMFHYKTNGRNFSWRERITPYRVSVSEIMLQQTQTVRVAEKFPEFIKLFPSFLSLSRATKADVIRAWQGLGYNRRALFLHNLAQIVTEKYNGRLPKDSETLKTLPGIGKNTAGSIAAFAFNEPTVFIETNIRSVFLYVFFKDKTDIPDSEIIPLIEKTLDRRAPRQWYWALMDAGVALKKEIGNPNRKSRYYAKQSAFNGSFRQIRGAILRALTAENRLTTQSLMRTLKKEGIADKKQVNTALEKLISDGFVRQKNGLLTFID